MVEDDFCLETADDSSDVEVLTNLVQGNTPTFDLKVDAAQPPQQTANEDNTSSSLSPKIPKSTLSAPIIFEEFSGEMMLENQLLPKLLLLTSK